MLTNISSLYKVEINLGMRKVPQGYILHKIIPAGLIFQLVYKVEINFGGAENISESC